MSQAETMRAVVLMGHGDMDQLVYHDDWPAPTAGPNDVLIKVHRTGICGTDVHIYQWDDWAQSTIPTPMIVGHEFVGEVVETGANVRDVKVGNIVSAEGHVVCGDCRNCRYRAE